MPFKNMPKATKGRPGPPRYSSTFSESRRDGTAAKIIHAVHEHVERLESAGRVVQFRIKDYDVYLQQEVSTVEATGAGCCIGDCMCADAGVLLRFTIPTEAGATHP